MANNGHLGYFYIRGVMHQAAIHICVQVFVWMYFFFSLGYIPRRIAGSYSNCMFNCLRNCQTVFQKWFYHFPFPLHTAGDHGKW